MDMSPQRTAQDTPPERFTLERVKNPNHPEEALEYVFQVLGDRHTLPIGWFDDQRAAQAELNRLDRQQSIDRANGQFPVAEITDLDMGPIQLRGGTVSAPDHCAVLIEGGVPCPGDVVFESPNRELSAPR